MKRRVGEASNANDTSTLPEPSSNTYGHAVMVGDKQWQTGGQLDYSKQNYRDVIVVGVDK